MFAPNNMTMYQQEICPCGSKNNYKECCAAMHQNHEKADSAEKLMRARYSAFVKYNIDFIYNTFHPNSRRFQNKKDIETWAKESKWMHLEIIKATENTVEFKAHYLDSALNPQVHHEKSSFKQMQGLWYYTEGRILS